MLNLYFNSLYIIISYEVHVNLDLPMYLPFPFLLTIWCPELPYLAPLFYVDSTVLRHKKEN